VSVRVKKAISKTLKGLALGLYLAFAIAPILWIFITSIKPPEDIYTFPIKYWTKNPSFEAYRYLFGFANFSRYFGNSLLVTFLASIVSTVFALFSGYALSRYSFKGKGFLVIFLFFTKMIPAYLLMIPQFQMFSSLKLTNNLFGIIIIYIGLGATFSTIMAKGYFDRIPVSMEEAGLIDGCTRIGVLFRITVPLLLPGLAAIFSFSFVNNWNELFTAALFLDSDSKMTVPVALYSFISKAGIQWNVLGAGIIVALVPTMIVFFFAQKYIVAGLTQGAVKE